MHACLRETVSKTAIRKLECQQRNSKQARQRKPAYDLLKLTEDLKQMYCRSAASTACLDIAGLVTCQEKIPQQTNPALMQQAPTLVICT